MAPNKKEGQKSSNQQHREKMPLFFLYAAFYFLEI